ncbi:MAG: aspartate kinase [Candidatus Hadarchaeaceae archaeon]
MRRIVVKFGGTSIGDADRIRLGAKSICDEYRRGTQILVVVSAVGHYTDELVRTARDSAQGIIDLKDFDDIMSMGERTSARIFSAVLKSMGVKSVYIDPAMEIWPVITDDNFGMANIDFEATKQRVQSFVVPLLEDRVVPVLCGFLGRDREGNVTTLGRGGSDITAFLIGRCLKVDEVIIVTDVDGVMTADPNRVQGAKLLKSITVEEMTDLARFGAQVMHPKSMVYKDPEISAKVIHYRHGNLHANGTEIIGPRGGNLERVRLHEKPLAMLTIVGESMQTTPGILAKFSVPLSKARINIYAISIGPRSFSIYLAEEDAKRALAILHRVVVGSRLKAITSEGNIAMIVAESERFIYAPGVIAKLTEPLARAKINIIEIISSRASISFFVNWDVREQALKLFEKAMKEIEG